MNTQAYGINGFGGYVPRMRLERSSIAKAHQWMAPSLKAQASGARAFCNWDEDVVTMAVEAACDALPVAARDGIRTLTLASTTQPFADLQSSALVAGALGLAPQVRTLDVGYSRRAATAGLIAAFEQQAGNTLFIASESPSARPASIQEITYGAGAAAFSFGEENVIASLAGSASRTAAFVDHFRSTGHENDYYWEERWIREEGYLKLTVEVGEEALREARMEPTSVDHLVVAAPLRGIAGGVARKLGIDAEAIADDLGENCGFAGAAHAVLMLAHTLEKAGPGQSILVLGFGQGADALVLNVTDSIRDYSPERGVSDALASGLLCDEYMRFLSYQGKLEPDFGMRAERNVKIALTEQYRSSDQLAGLTAGKCKRCDTIQFPQLPYCVNPECNATREQFEPYDLRGKEAEVATFTNDWLSYHPAPPLRVGFVQFEGGGRLQVEITDTETSELDVGLKVRMVFRIKDVDRQRGYRRYFWKAAPAAR